MAGIAAEATIAAAVEQAGVGHAAARPGVPAPKPAHAASTARSNRTTAVVRFTAVLVAAYADRFLSGVATRAIAAVRTTPGCAKVLLLWNRPRAELDAALRDAAPPMTLAAVQAQRGAPLRVLFESVNSLNNRYRHLGEIETEAVVIFDDDVRAFMLPELTLGVLQPWSNDRTRLVSTCARTIARPPAGAGANATYKDIQRFTYRRANLMLPHVMAFDKGLLELYMSPRYAALRHWVDADPAHCDDVLLNFVYQSERRRPALWPYAPERFMTEHDGRGVSAQARRKELRAGCARHIARHLPAPASGAPPLAWLQPADRLFVNKWSHDLHLTNLDQRERGVLSKLKHDHDASWVTLELPPGLPPRAVPVLPFRLPPPEPPDRPPPGAAAPNPPLHDVHDERLATIAVVASEFFDERVSRMGGFGYSTRMVGRVFTQHPELGVSLVYVMACGGARLDGKRQLTGETLVHGWPLVNLCNHAEGATSGPVSTAWARAYLLAAKVRLFLFIDYRTNYKPAHDMLPAVPIVLWARDPRTQAQRHRIQRITVPGGTKRAKGASTPDARGARALWATGRVGVGMTYGRALRDRAPEAYNLSSDAVLRELPNTISMCAVHGLALEPKPAGMEAPSPEVLFLARLDPYKRPWLLVELARAFPEVTFYAAGKSHFVGPRAFTPPADGEVPNLKFLGHVASEMEKAERLARAWFVVNLSAHEGVAISWLEAFHCRTPVLSTVDPGGLVSRFGRFAGEWKGNGLAGLPRIKAAFSQLLTNRSLRAELGVAARRHVLETHNTPRFVRKLVELVELVSPAEPAGAASAAAAGPVASASVLLTADDRR